MKKKAQDENRLPCPFCGNDSSRVQLFRYHFQVICNECSSRTAAYVREEDALKSWNMRATPNNGRG